MTRSRRPSKRKGCAGCYDDGYCVVNRHDLCPQCMAKWLKAKCQPAKDQRDVR